MQINGKITSLAAVILLSLPSFAQKVLKGDFKVEVRTMYPQRYPSRMVTDFSLEVKDGEAIVYLPYMGEVYVPSLSSEGLNFTEKMRKLSHQTNTKGQEILYFVLKRHELSYEFVVRTDSNGEADITMRPSNGQQCGYHGDLEVTDVKTNALLNQLPKCAVGSKDKFCDGRLDDLLQHIDGLSYCEETPMGKHFKDLPVASSEQQAWLADETAEPSAFLKDAVWMEKTISLYPSSNPQVSDANQTAIGDCNCISLFAEMAYLYPKFVKRIIKQESPHCYSVKMFTPQGKRINVKVSNKVMCNKDGGILQCKGKNETATWSTVLEKALMKWLQVYKGSSESIGGFGAELMMPIFTGDGRSFSIRPGVLNAQELQQMVIECLNHGLLVNGGFLRSDIPLDKHVTISGHGHTFMHPTEDDVLFRVRNPWGHGEDDHIMNVKDDGIIPPLIDLRIISAGIASKDFRKGHDNFKR